MGPESLVSNFDTNAITQDTEKFVVEDGKEGKIPLFLEKN